MVRLCAVLVLALLISACGSKSTEISTLQKYQRHGSQLSDTTSESQRVALDLRRLNAALSRDSLVRIKRSNGSLLRDAAALRRDARALQSTIRRLAAESEPASVRHYLWLVFWTLQAQAREAWYAHRLAGVIHWDPLLKSPAKLAFAQRLSRRARSSAKWSVSLSQRAQTLREQHPNDFRYSPAKAG